MFNWTTWTTMKKCKTCLVYTNNLFKLFWSCGHETLPQHLSSLKKLGDGQSLKRKLSVNLSRAMCSLLDFLSLEDGTDRLSQTLVRNYHHTLHISEQRRSHTMIWHAGLGLVPHGTVQSDLVWHFIHEFTKTSHIELPNLREKPHFIF
jgi:hypothetical protein